MEKREIKNQDQELESYTPREYMRMLNDKAKLLVELEKRERNRIREMNQILDRQEKEIQGIKTILNLS